MSKIKNLDNEWYDLNHILGYSDCFFYILLGARCAGKSYAVMDWCLKRFKKHGEQFYWLRINEASIQKMKQNNAKAFVDPDLQRKYDLELSCKGDVIFDHGQPMCTCLALSTAANSKGQALFDKDYTGNYNVVLDEFQLEKSQKRCFDLCYNLVVQLENIVRMRKDGIKIFMIGNSTEECSDILSMMNFIPEHWGIFHLKNKRCVIENIQPTQRYLKNRKGSVGDILAGNTSNYTNEIICDSTHVTKRRLNAPSYIIKFTKDPADWFTVWDSNVICKYNKEQKEAVAMRRYIDEKFDPLLRDQIFGIYDARSYYFKDLITQKQFGYQLALIKKQ